LHLKAAFFRGHAAAFNPIQAMRWTMSVLQGKQLALTALAAALGVALGSNVVAQQEPTRENANRPQTDQQIARSDAGMQSLEQYLQSNTLRVSKLAGMELQARNGDNLAEVQDVLRAMAPGQDMQLVVQLGGVGAEERLVAIPFDEIQINSDGDELYTNRTREQLASAPAIALDRREGGIATPAQRSASDANRDAAERGAADAGRDAADRAQPGAPAGGAAQTQTQRGTASTANEQRLADLIGSEVVGSGGDAVGEVEDIVISMAGADSVRAVLQVGGIAGIGEKRVALPLGQINVERSPGEEPTLRVAMDGDSLERLPEFEFEEDTSIL
jgi:sporulation protein YlmC with PRC-barrel domain